MMLAAATKGKGRERRRVSERRIAVAERRMTQEARTRLVLQERAHIEDVMLFSPRRRKKCFYHGLVYGDDELHRGATSFCSGRKGARRSCVNRRAAAGSACTWVRWYRRTLVAEARAGGSAWV